MKTYFVARIHNNSLGSCYSVANEQEGIDLIKKLAVEQFGRPLTDDEDGDADERLEISNEEDSDNYYCFSVGIIEE